MPPPTGTLKLNFDGSVLGNPRQSCIGGGFRHSKGVCLLSFSGHYGFRSLKEAELIALCTGLQEAARRGFKNFMWRVIPFVR